MHRQVGRHGGFLYRIWSERWGMGWGEHKAWGTEAQFLTCCRPDCQTLNLVKVIERERWEIKTRKREKWEWLMEGLEPTTWQMACHALTNWATESLSYSVTEFKYLRLSYQGSSWSRYQGGMFDGEGVVRDRGSVFNILQTLTARTGGFCAGFEVRGGGVASMKREVQRLSF